MIKEKKLKPSQEIEVQPLIKHVKIQTAEGWKRAMFKKKKQEQKKSNK